jgi:hypothetical protein
VNKAEKKAARHRRASREWMRRYRARKAEATDGAEPFNFEEPAPAVIPTQKPAAPEPPAPEWKAPPSLPPITRPDPWLFDTLTDRYRPAFWDAICEPSVIQIGLSPRAVRRTPPIAIADTVQTAVDPGIEFSISDGHRDLAAERAEAAQAAERSKGDFRAWLPGQEENE